MHLYATTVQVSLLIYFVDIIIVVKVLYFFSFVNSRQIKNITIVIVIINFVDIFSPRP